MKPPNESRKFRQDHATECKRHARAARVKCGVTLKTLAAVLQLKQTSVQRKLGLMEDAHRELTYSELHLLARNPETAPMVRAMLASLLELTDPQNLRLSDLAGVASTASNATLVLAILRPTIDRLEPLANLSDTGESEA